MFLSFFFSFSCSNFQKDNRIILFITAITGLAALRRLLTGATNVKSGKNDVNLYIKLGTSKTAMEDFYSVKPTDVKEFTNTFRYGRNQAMVRFINKPNKPEDQRS